MKNSRNKIVQLLAYKEPDFMALTDFHQPSRRREAQKGSGQLMTYDKPSVKVSARHGLAYDAHQQSIRRDRRQSVLKSTPAACSF